MLQQVHCNNFGLLGLTVSDCFFDLQINCFKVPRDEFQKPQAAIGGSLLSSPQPSFKVQSQPGVCQDSTTDSEQKTCCPLDSYVLIELIEQDISTEEHFRSRFDSFWG